MFQSMAACARKYQKKKKKVFIRLPDPFSSFMTEMPMI